MSKLFDNANNDGFVNQSDPENVQIDALKTTEDQIREALEKSYTKDKLNKQKKFNAVCLRKLANTLPEHEGLVRMKARVPVLHNLIPTPKDVDDYSTMDLYPTFIALKSSFNPQPADSTDAVPPGTAIVVQFDNVSNFANPEILEISVIKSEEDLASAAAAGSGSSTTSRRSPDGKRVRFKKDIVAPMTKLGTSWYQEASYFTGAKSIGGKYNGAFRGGYDIAYNKAFIEEKPPGSGLYEHDKSNFAVAIKYQLSCENADGTGTNSRIFTSTTIDLHKDHSKRWSQDSTTDFSRDSVSPATGKQFGIYPKYMINPADADFRWNTNANPGKNGVPAVILAKDSNHGFYVRSDMKDDFKAVIDEVRGNGGLIACGTARIPKVKVTTELEKKYPGLAKAATGKTKSGTAQFKVFSDTLPSGLTDTQKKEFYNDKAFSLHHTGHAIDFTPWAACSFPLTDPYIVAFDGLKGGSPLWRVYYRASGAPMQTISAIVMAGVGNVESTSDGEYIPQIQKVTVPCYDFTALMAKNGFERISSKTKQQRWQIGAAEHKLKFGSTTRKWQGETSASPAMKLANNDKADFQALIEWNSSKECGDTIKAGSGAYFKVKNFRKWSEWWHFDYVKGVKAGGTGYTFYQALEGYFSTKSLTDPAKFSSEFLDYAKLAVASKSGHSFKIP